MSDVRDAHAQALEFVNPLDGVYAHRTRTTELDALRALDRERVLCSLNPPKAIARGYARYAQEPAVYDACLRGLRG